MNSATLPVQPQPAHDLEEEADRLEEAGRFLDAARTLERIDVDERGPLVDVRIVSLRHRAFRSLVHEPAAADTSVPPDLFPGAVEPPEIASSDLTAEVLRSALHHHGCLIVRGLLDTETCAGLRDDIDQAFDAYDDRAFKPVAATAPWFADLAIDEGNLPLDPMAGAFLRAGGGVYGPCAPRAFVEYRRRLDEAGLVDVVAAYLGEPPVVSVNKCVLRRIGGGAHPTWHQDGCYLGTDVPAVNLWLSLSRCGGDTDVMGLDILPGPQKRLAEAGTHDAIDERAISQHVVDELAEASGRPTVRPLFEPGDGVLFDQLFIHRSDVRPLPKERYAVESWFFTPSAYPSHQIPVVAV